MAVSRIQLLSWDPRFMSTTSLSSCASSTDPAGAEPRTKVIMHKVSEHDTLPGLAIRYDVKVFFCMCVTSVIPLYLAAFKGLGAAF